MQNKKKKFGLDEIITIALAGVLVLTATYLLFTYKKPLSLQATKIVTKREVNVYCDEETQIEYLIYTGDDRAGITVRYDGNGRIKRCDKHLSNSNKK